MAYPSPPWSLRGQLWLSLFYASPAQTPRGLYAVVFADHEAGSTVTYRDLLVGAVTRGHDGGRRLRLRQAWADRDAAAEGLRAFAGWPVETGELDRRPGGLGPVDRTEWSASQDGEPIVAAEFADTSRVVLRTPVRASTRQERPDGTPVTTALRGSGRTLPCLATWDFASAGPLGWLAGRQPVASFRSRDVRLTLGSAPAE